MRTCSNDSGLILFSFVNSHCSVSIRISVQESSFLTKGGEMAEEGAEMPVIPKCAAGCVTQLP